MSKVTEAINYWVFEKRETHVILPRSLFSKQDQPLIDSGAFRLIPDIAKSVECPFGCGDREEVWPIELENGEWGYFISCQNGEGEKVLDPIEYQLMEFVPEVYFRNWGGIATKLDVKIAKPKKRQGPRNTAFMDYQRKTTIAYVVEKCHRPISTLTLADCRHVWNLPIHKATWDKRAKMKNDMRGYWGPKAVFQSIKSDKQATKGQLKDN